MSANVGSRRRPESCLRQGWQSISAEVLTAGGRMAREFSALEVWRDGLSLDSMCTLLMRLADRGLLELKGTDELGFARYGLPDWPGTRITRAYYEERIWPEAQALGFPKRELFDYVETVLAEEVERGIVFLSTADGWENLYACQVALGQAMAFESGCARAFRLDDWHEGLVLVGAFAEEVERICPRVNGRWLLGREQRLGFLDGMDLNYWVGMSRDLDHDCHIMAQRWLVRDCPERGEELEGAYLRGESDGLARNPFAPKTFDTVVAKAYEHGYAIGELAALERRCPGQEGLGGVYINSERED